MATLEKRGARWRALVRRKGHPATSRTFSTKAAARSWALKTERAMEAGEFKSENLLEDWTLDDLIARVRELHQRPGRTKAAALVMLSRELGTALLQGLTKARIIGYIRYRATDHGAGPATLKQDLVYLRGVLQTGRDELDLPIDLGAIDAARTVLRRAGLVGSSRRRDRRPTTEELEALRLYWAGPKQRTTSTPMWVLVRFACATAMRLSEITRIRWADLNETDRTVIIRDRKHPRRKVGNDQTVPLLGEAWDLVMAQPRTDPRIFPYNPRTISSLFTRAVQRLRIDDLRFHDLRHHAISLLFEQGFSVPEVALVSGHRDWSQLARYTQLQARDLHR